jgi:hypothetical protein
MIEVFDIGSTQAEGNRCNIEMDKHPESFIRVHHPSCGHCKAMEQAWSDVENTLKSNYTGNAGIFNIHADTLSNITNPGLQGIQGYPTMMVIKTNTPTQYNGDRSMNDLLTFALKNMNLKKKQKTSRRKSNTRKKRRKTVNKRKRRARTRGGRKKRTGKR